MAVFDRPDDVLRPERRITAEKYLRKGGLEGHLVDLGDIPFIELDADALLDPRKGVLLSDRENHIVAREKDIAQAARRRDVAAVDVVLQFLEHHAEESA